MTLPDDTALRGWVSCPRCLDPIRVLKKDDRISWWPALCKHCKAPLHLAEDFDLATFTAEDDNA